MLAQEKAAHYRFKTSGNQSDREDFSNLRARCNLLRKNCRISHINNVEHSISRNPKYFQRHLNKNRSFGGMPNVMHLGDKQVSTNQEIVNLFADNYAAVHETNILHGFKPLNSSTLDVSNVEIALSEVFERVSAINCNKDPGPDGIPPSFFKN